jgi:hypothetical protein
MVVLYLIVSFVPLWIHSVYFSDFGHLGAGFCKGHGVFLLRGTAWVFNCGQVFSYFYLLTDTLNEPSAYRVKSQILAHPVFKM